MNFGILGPLEVFAGTRRLNTGGLRQQLLLGGLLLNTGRTVGMADLVDVVWGEDPPVTARSQVYTAVYQIRCVLDRHGGRGLVRTESGGYRMDVGAEQLDLTRFHTGLAAARARVSSGDLEEAADAFRRALGLWRGRPLLGLAGNRIERWTGHLTEVYLAAVDECIDVEMALGRHRKLIVELSAYMAEYPLRESLAASLMAALWRDGRPADALRVYQRTAGVLQEELGIDPGSKLQQTYTDVLRGATPTTRPIGPTGPP